LFHPFPLFPTLSRLHYHLRDRSHFAAIPVLTNDTQDALLAVTNTFEGREFVSNLTTTTTLVSYVLNAFSALDAQNISAIVDVYSQIDGLDTVLDQAIAVQGECSCFVPLNIVLRTC
jgi:hypothetical protein